MANPLLDKTGGRTRPFGELQEKERLSSDLARLHKALLRLAIAHYGENPELDQQLTLLSNTIRNPERRNNLPKLIEEVVATIVSSDTQSRRVSENPLATAINKIMQTLADRLQWEDHTEAPWGAIKHQLQSNPSTKRMNAILDDCLRLICTRIEPPDEISGHDNVEGMREAAENLLDGALVALETSADLQALRERIHAAGTRFELLKLLDEAAAQLARALAASASPPAAGVAETGTAETGEPVRLARQSLLSLLDKLNFPAKATTIVNEIRTLLGEDAGRDELARADARLAELIRDTLAHARREVREINNFLKQVMTGLQDVRQEMLTLSHARSHALKDSETLGKSVNDRMTELYVSVGECNDLETLKSSVSTYLETFREEVNSYVENERLRHQDTETAMANLSGQLQSLAGETLRLRDDIQQERLRALSDPLTGLSNRLGLEERLAHEVATWQRESYPLAIIILDIDHFKSINDQFGHQAGDRVLRTVADQLRSQIRRSDFLARYGGEEFVMLLPQTGLADAAQLADKLRHHIASCKFIYRDVQVPVTLSCGIAEFHKGDTNESVLDRADQALYVAKNEGRNRCHTEEDLSATTTSPSEDVTSPLTVLTVQ